MHCAHIWLICLVLYSISWHDKFWTFSGWKETSLTWSLVDFKATVWEYCFAMCREQTVCQLGWLIKLLGFVNTKCIGDVQIIFQTQLTLYKLDTSIICCSVMVSTSDVSRKHIGDMANLAARRHGWWEGTTELLKRPLFRLVAVSRGNGTG